jgi:hypothetical protein
MENVREIVCVGHRHAVEDEQTKVTEESWGITVEAKG